MLSVKHAKQFGFKLYDRWLRLQICRNWERLQKASAAHNLPRPLIVSLTSYPPRFKTLDLTLRCLLAQSIRADQTILWIAHRDRQAITEEIESLTSKGLTIRYCEDVRSHKKYAYTF